MTDGVHTPERSTMSTPQPKMDVAQLHAALEKQRIDAATFWELPGPVIGTHDGRFHLDEVLAISMLLSLPQWREARVVRTRDAELLRKCAVVVDVGGVYDSETLRFDHHQRDFCQKFDFARFQRPEAGAHRPAKMPRRQQQETDQPLQAQEGQEDGDLLARQPVTKLSSAGLVFLHFGQELLQTRFGISDPEASRVMQLAVYLKFVEAVDAIDNGVEPTKDGSPLLYDDATGLSRRVGQLYPGLPFQGTGSSPDDTRAGLKSRLGWECVAAAEAAAFELANRELLDEISQPLQPAPAAAAAAAPVVPPAQQQQLTPSFRWTTVPILGGTAEEIWAFRKALRLADAEMAACVTQLRDNWLPGFDILQKALDLRAAEDFASVAVELPHWCPTDGHLGTLERDRGLSPIAFLVYPADRPLPNGQKTVTWTVRCVSEEDSSFTSRLPLHVAFRGLRDEALGSCVLSGSGKVSSFELPGAAETTPRLSPSDFVFCHATGFMAVAKTREAAYEMIRQTVSNRDTGDSGK